LPEFYRLKAFDGRQSPDLRASVAQLGTQLVISFRVFPLTKLDIPAARPKPEARERLWEHTCFEVFVQAEGMNSYLEWNASPSGDWAVFAFRAYRDRIPLEGPGFDPALHIKEDEGGLEIAMTLQTSAWLAFWPQARTSGFRLGLASVLRDASGGLSYWSLLHPSVKPDFHDARSYILELGPGILS